LSPGALQPDVDLVKEFARAVDRLRQGEVCVMRLVGLARANPERQALVHGLVEDHEPSLGADVVVRTLPGGDIEIARRSTVGEVIEIDISKATPD
jgi:hypothetical protein